MTVNYLSSGEGRLGINYTLGALGAKTVSGDESFAGRAKDLNIGEAEYKSLSKAVKAIGVSARFKDVIKTFSVPEGEIPAGFRPEAVLKADGLLELDLVRDIAYDKNGEKRPTGVIFSADSANPYEVESIAPLLGNLTCNPGIVYDLFINNPKANVGRKFRTRDEVMAELGRILGPGCDISVELNNPFEEDFSKILEECECFREILSEYRLVIKVPHMGPVNGRNVGQLLEGDKLLDTRYDQPATADAFRSHQLALRLREHGYRINYTLMFEPYQTALAMQAKPYFINSFIRHRAKQSDAIRTYINSYELTGDRAYVEQLRTFMIKNDYLSSGEGGRELLDVLKLGKDLLKYRRFEEDYGNDGLDGVRQNLKWLRQSKLRDTKLIICSMEGPFNYPDIDRLLSDPEYQDMSDRVVVTAEPGYLGRFTSTNQVISYQRRFMNAVKGAE